MRSYFNRSSPFIAGLHHNAVMQLVLASGVTFVAFNIIHAIMWLLGYRQDEFFTNVVSVLSLMPVDQLHFRFWTLLTYGWISLDFWALVSSMFWLYCFGSLVQMLIGYKQVIPIYVYSLFVGGIFFYLSQLIPGRVFIAHPYYMSSAAGIMGLMVAAITLVPDYRFFLGDRFSIPLWVVSAIFSVLMLLNSGGSLPVIFLLLAGSGMGYLYVKLLKAGNRPGEWIYDFFDKVEGLVTPKPRPVFTKVKRKGGPLNYQPKQGFTQKRIDDILDKINQKGYNALTQEEKDILIRASKDNN